MLSVPGTGKALTSATNASNMAIIHTNAHPPNQSVLAVQDTTLLSYAPAPMMRNAHLEKSAKSDHDACSAKVLILHLIEHAQYGIWPMRKHMQGTTQDTSHCSTHVTSDASTGSDAQEFLYQEFEHRKITNYPTISSK